MRPFIVSFLLFASVAVNAQITTLRSSNDVQGFATNVLTHATNKYTINKVDSTNTTVSYWYESADSKTLAVKFSKFKDTYKPNWIIGSYADLFGFWQTIQPDADMTSLEKSGKTFKKIDIDGTKYWLASFYKSDKDWVIKVNDY